ncbi:MAG: F0F1 ATPase subunit [Firmicutes bacterium HGW-Firmicutes-1]|jgi:ATP synthase protein I|nr:MAG: F0F1 ATPase subunit [Firmicutes bacterium HGW-Firmicutes-1]
MKLDYSALKNLSLLSQVGFLMAIPIIGCILLGSYLDGLLGTNIIFLIVFTILGVMAAFRNLYVLSVKKNPSGKKAPKK